MRAEPQATPNTHMVARDTHESQLPNKASHCRITRPQPLKGRAGGQAHKEQAPKSAREATLKGSHRVRRESLIAVSFPSITL